jgi:hypothetical protein
MAETFCKLFCTRHEGIWCSRCVFLNTASGGGEWSASRSCCFTPGGRDRYPLERRLDVFQTRSRPFREEQNVLLLPGVEPGFNGCLACYADDAIPVHTKTFGSYFKCITHIAYIGVVSSVTWAPPWEPGCGSAYKYLGVGHTSQVKLACLQRVVLLLCVRTNWAEVMSTSVSSDTFIYSFMVSTLSLFRIVWRRMVG